MRESYKNYPNELSLNFTSLGSKMLRMQNINEAQCEALLQTWLEYNESLKFENESEIQKQQTSNQEHCYICRNQQKLEQCIECYGWFCGECFGRVRKVKRENEGGIQDQKIGLGEGVEGNTCLKCDEIYLKTLLSDEFNELITNKAKLVSLFFESPEKGPSSQESLENHLSSESTESSPLSPEPYIHPLLVTTSSLLEELSETMCSLQIGLEKKRQLLETKKERKSKYEKTVSYSTVRTLSRDIPPPRVSGWWEDEGPGDCLKETTIKSARNTFTGKMGKSNEIENEESENNKYKDYEDINESFNAVDHDNNHIDGKFCSSCIVM